MYTYAALMPDLNLVALGVVVWVVAISVAFGFYLPFLRAERWVPPRRAAAKLPLIVLEDLDHAPIPCEAAAFGDLVVAPADTVSPPGLPQASALAAPPPPGPEAVPAPITGEALGPARTPEAFSVLVVDDNAINRQVLELILDSVGMAHVSVVNGQEAVEAMRETAYDAVLMDLQMPVMDGFEATRRIRQMEAGRGAAHSTIIVVSANCLDEHIAAGRQAGADAHLAKPISAGALIGELAACPTLNRMAA